MSCSEEVISQEQYFGVVKGIDEKGLIIECGVSREERWLPSALEYYEPASKGEYCLRSSGQVVTDPDFIATFKCYAKEQNKYFCYQVVQTSCATAQPPIFRKMPNSSFPLSTKDAREADRPSFRDSVQNYGFVSSAKPTPELGAKLQTDTCPATRVWMTR